MKPKKDAVSREIEQIERENLLDMYKTAQTKVKLISELKNGLGEDIKKNPNKVTFIKKTVYQRFMITIMKIFTKFYN